MNAKILILSIMLTTPYYTAPQLYNSIRLWRKYMGSNVGITPVDTGRKLNVHKTLNVLDVF